MWLLGVAGMGSPVLAWDYQAGMWIGPCRCHALHHLPGFGAGFLGVFCMAQEGIFGPGGGACVSLRWRGPFIGCGALGLLKTMTSTCVSGF